jgi:hypothetical protein
VQYFLISPCLPAPVFTPIRDVRADVGRARLHELPRVRRVVAVVEAVGEAGAVREPDGVRGHVARAEVVPGERGGEVLDAHVGSRQPARHVAGLGDEAVQPAELHGPVRAGRLSRRCHNHRVNR